MQLKHLKLAGFKSFVDPTLVPFSSQLVAVVGPNGCGKSNIIDAVRWVMGEGSAKALRGDSMVDVIFNGSSTRKPVGQASVELVFDNSLGRLTGLASQYQEISIKRLVTRDGDSHYLLNGSRCRRRDITDLFLGTGAGTRGYSIIGQNTISQLVEARPDDLKAYFEEAAGVSKYKERRRETLTRIHHTRENLLRVQDIHRELSSQLQRLERQAKAAERYTHLKSTERQCRGDILALKWRLSTNEQAQKHVELTQSLCVQEESQAHVSRATKAHADLSSQYNDAQLTFQTVQSAYYQVGTELARLQEIHQQHLREQQQGALDQQQMQAELVEIERQLQVDSETIHDSKQVLIDLLERAEAAHQALADLSVTHTRAERYLADSHQSMHALQSQLNQAQREVAIGETHLKHVQQRHHDGILRLEKIVDERQSMDQLSEQNGLETLFEQHSLALEEIQVAQESHQQHVAMGKELSEKLLDLEAKLRKGQDALHSLTTQYAVMEATQNAALAGEKIPAAILGEFQNHPRLWALMSVEPRWRAACEWILGESLKAITLSSFESLQEDLPSLVGQPLGFIWPINTECPVPRASRLIDKIEGFKPACSSSLEHILTADTLDEALAQHRTLEAYQSIITPDGFWLGKGWVKIANFIKQDEQSLLLRKSAMIELKQALDHRTEQNAALIGERDELHVLRVDNERQQQGSTRQCAETQKASAECATRYTQKKQAHDHALLQKARLEDDEATLRENLESEALNRVRFEADVHLATQQSTVYAQQLETLMHQKKAQEETLAISRQHMEVARAADHHLQRQCDHERLKSEQLSVALIREQGRCDHLKARLLQLNQRLDELNGPEKHPTVPLSDALVTHQRLELELGASREQVDGLHIQLNTVQQEKQHAEQQTRLHEVRVVELQMAEQAAVLQVNAFLASSMELNIDLAAIATALPADGSLRQMEQQLQETTASIARLGAINLVAIEEYQIELARQTHLEEQSRDLNEAVLILESAIAKMDHETEGRLKETFDEVNRLFQRLFPRLFGGGQARLELTCDNLLEAGVVVMAQPPGKRNSTIHLLSGGEKAMTAVALVFAIFQLNPSPFCMLDEVDAPLDDLNVGRFCDLVKEMSETVQFLLISHNKVTMELADHLIGVTMREPGVSRIVAVDVESALSLVEPMAN